MDEAELIGAAQSGDRAAFDELVRRTFVDTFTLARRLTGNEEDARDVVQDAYLRAWQGIGKFRGEAQFSTWMYRITANAASTHVRKRRRHRTEPLDDDLEPADVAARVASPRPRPSRPTRSDGSRRALDELPPKLRTVVVLKDVYDLSHEAIAEELGITVAAAKVRLHRARRQPARRAVRRRSRSSCGVTRSPRCCRGSSTAIDRRRTSRSNATSSRACAARPSWPATASCSARLAAAAHPLRRADAGPARRDARRAHRGAAERRAVHSIVSGRRLAYAGAIGGTAVATAATAACSSPGPAVAAAHCGLAS